MKKNIMVLLFVVGFATGSQSVFGMEFLRSFFSGPTCQVDSKDLDLDFDEHEKQRQQELPNLEKVEKRNEEQREKTQRNIRRITENISSKNPKNIDELHFSMMDADK